MSIKTKLSELYVPGNIKNFVQICKIYYYPPEQEYPTDKIWLYFDGEEKGEKRRIKSLCFKNPENHKKFIINNIYAHIYQLIKRAGDRIPNHIEKIKYQKALLDDLLIKAKKETLKRWEDENGKKRL